MPAKPRSPAPQSAPQRSVAFETGLDAGPDESTPAPRLTRSPDPGAQQARQALERWTNEGGHSPPVGAAL